MDDLPIQQVIRVGQVRIGVPQSLLIDAKTS